MKNCLVMVLALVFTAILLTGCGETFNGIGKDINRVGKGIHTVFIRDTDK